MSQANLVVANGNGATVRAAINSNLQALGSMMKGSTAPSTTYDGMLWLDDSATPWIVKQFDGSDWIPLYEVNATSNSAAARMDLHDANGNEILKRSATASAVNEVTLANAATGGAPGVSATGDDTNIGLSLSGKGTGLVSADGADVVTGLGVLQSVTTLSGAANADFTGFDGTYDTHVFILQNLVPSNDDKRLDMFLSDAAAFNTGASDYAWRYIGARASGAIPNGSSGDSKLVISPSEGANTRVGSDAGEYGISGIVIVHNPTDSGAATHVTYQTVTHDAANNIAVLSGGGWRTTAEDNDGVRFAFSGANLESGTIIHRAYRSS